MNWPAQLSRFFSQKSQLNTWAEQKGVGRLTIMIRSIQAIGRQQQPDRSGWSDILDIESLGSSRRMSSRESKT
jgi:hypothetical protein